ncbi:MAG: PPOX class F420-dependent oxidoreductase [Deltaproteobacteria bacterium]|nr:MAG: PPOX class F420-dependent oxidoreductase [Deltaproteobacteria bacterium]
MDAASLAALDRESYINLGTYRRNGKVVDTPVWFAEHGGRLYVFSAGDAGKVKRLRATPRIRVAPCDVRGTLRGDWIEGTGRRVEDPRLIEAAYAALLRKYGLLMRLTNLLSRLTGRIERRAILELSV